MQTSTLYIRIAALLVGGVLLATPSSAQNEPMRSLSIRDGQVVLDGKVVPPSELPQSLDLEGVQVHYTFSGDVRPVIDINGDYFVIDADGLRDADGSELDRASLSLRQGRMTTGGGFGFVVGDDDDPASFDPMHVAGMEEQARELAEQALRFRELQEQLVNQYEAGEMKELTAAAQRLSDQAVQAARVAEALPRLKVESYLAGVQEHDQELYNMLVEERELEAQTIHLAREIRQMPEGNERAERTEELRRKLEEAFELKQSSRRGEISQLEDRLEELQERLEDRERMRQEIIDNRLRQLLRLENEYQW